VNGLFGFAIGFLGAFDNEANGAEVALARPAPIFWAKSSIRSLFYTPHLLLLFLQILLMLLTSLVYSSHKSLDVAFTILSPYLQKYFLFDTQYSLMERE
jgi:hypothetical protein